MSRLNSISLLLGSSLLLVACNSSPTVQNTQPPTPIVTNTVPTPATTGGELKKVYSMEEVAKHTTPQDCWLVIDGKVYNVSNFGDTQHPGGEAIYQGCGKDATQFFETRPMGSKTPHSETARSFLPNFYIGDLAR